MRDIEEILEELEEHPDYIHGYHIWTVDNVIDDIRQKLYNNEVYDDYVNESITFDDDYFYSQESVDYIESLKPVITRDMFTKEDWDIIKDKLNEEETRLSLDMDITPYDVRLLSFHTQVIRNIKLDKILRDETKN